MKNVRFDPVSRFAAQSLLAVSISNVLVVLFLPAKTLLSLSRWRSRNRGSFLASFAGARSGSTTRARGIWRELPTSRLGLDLVHVLKPRWVRAGVDLMRLMAAMPVT